MNDRDRDEVVRKVDETFATTESLDGDGTRVFQSEVSVDNVVDFVILEVERVKRRAPRHLRH